MIYTFNIDDSTEKGKAILYFLKSFGMLEKGNPDIDIPNWQKEEVKRSIEELEKSPQSGIDFDQSMDELASKYFT
ncbi:addiction module protein [Crocinitomix catalasitica]|uniref:addiction module protein n=1 Tax=Crocinitomix catalasitica TaxID=184607 RepID=UPI000480FB3D|nr:addiction module protein [Crocinitomix catalasitica]